MSEAAFATWLTNLECVQIKFSHKISNRVSDTFAVHTHAFYELVYVVSGNVHFFIGDRQSAVGAGTLLCFPPGLRHGVKVSDTTPYERYTLHFDPQGITHGRRYALISALPQLAEAVPLDPEQESPCVRRGMEHSGIVQLLEAAEVLRTCSPDVRDSLMPIYCEAVLASVQLAGREKGAAPAETPRQNSMVQRMLIDYINQHYTEPVNLSELASRFFLSKGYLNSLFKRATGATIKDYVRERRMTHVQMLLRAGVPPSQAAIRSGFNDYTTFYRTYVRQFGHAPSADGHAGSVNTPLAQALIQPVTLQRETVSWTGENHGRLFSLEGSHAEDPTMWGTDDGEDGAPENQDNMEEIL